MKNRFKINAKTIENRPKMDQKSVLEGSRGPLGGSWRPRLKKEGCDPNLCGLLGPSWGRLGGLLGPSWRLDRRLGPSWAILVPSWAVLKSMSKSIKKSMPFKIGFWSDFNWFLKEKWMHVGIKIEQKSMPTSKSDFLKKPRFSIGKKWFSRFRGSKLEIKIDEKSIKKWIQDRERLLDSILSGFGWVWGGLWDKLDQKHEYKYKHISSQ